jgi:6-phosphogluconolactonase
MSEVTWAERGDDDAVAARLASVIAAPGRKRLALPGGRTPAGVLERLTGLALPWSTVELTPTDDRVVAPDHPASNYGQLRRAFEGKPVRLEPLAEGGAPPRFDLVWLGMGVDGHIASLFANVTSDPADRPAIVRVRPDPLPPEAPYERLSLNLAALVRTDAIVIVVRGAQKRTVLLAAIAGRVDLPVTRLMAAARSPATIFWSP